MIGTSHTLGAVPQVLAAQPCSRKITKVILHHTWAPTAAQYQGRKTIEGIHRYHTEDNGWSDIGYHYLIAPDGTLWLGRPLAEDGAHVLNHNHNTVGVSMILNGDVELPSPAQAATTGLTLKTLLERFRLDPAKNFGPHSGFHRDYSTKSCPGTRITKAMVLDWLRPTESVAPTPPEPSPFAADAWQWAREQGLLDGTRPHDAVTREELAVALERFRRLP